MPHDLPQKEAALEKLIDQGETDKAVALILELITACAGNNDFNKAEDLREKLYDVDAMALDAILQAGEIIEAAKSSGFDQDHRTIWAALYDRLAAEEANTLFYSLQDVAFNDNKVILHQSRPNTRLFFINEGSAKISHGSGSEEILLKKLETGDVFGQETFFSINVCTTTVTSLSRLKVSVLEQATYDKWGDRQFALQDKLKKFCLAGKSVEDLLNAKGLDRRRNRRIRLNTSIAVQIIKDDFKSLVGKAFRGEMADISSGGLSFLLRSKKVDTIRLLLGRNLIARFIIPVQQAEHKISLIGTVQGVHDLLFNEFSVHLKFIKPLDAKVMQAVEKFAQKQ